MRPSIRSGYQALLSGIFFGGTWQDAGLSMVGGFNALVRTICARARCNLLLVVLEIGSLPSVPPRRQAHWALRSVLAYFWAWCGGC